MEGMHVDGPPRASLSPSSAPGSPGASLGRAYVTKPEGWCCQWTSSSLPAANCKLFFPDVWGLLLLGYSTQQRLLRYWRDVPLLLLSTAEGDVLNLPGGERDPWQDKEPGVPVAPSSIPCAGRLVSFHLSTEGVQQGSGRLSIPLHLKSAQFLATTDWLERRCVAQQIQAGKTKLVQVQVALWVWG